MGRGRILFGGRDSDREERLPQLTSDETAVAFLASFDEKDESPFVGLLQVEAAQQPCGSADGHCRGISGLRMGL